jgi:hypothetical protein
MRHSPDLYSRHFMLFFYLDQTVILNEARPGRRTPVFPAFLAHLPAAGEALRLAATRKLSQAPGRVGAGAAALKAGGAAGVFVLRTAAAPPNLAT